jgi:hypothetical protein
MFCPQEHVKGLGKSTASTEPQHHVLALEERRFVESSWKRMIKKAEAKARATTVVDAQRQMKQLVEMDEKVDRYLYKPAAAGATVRSRVKDFLVKQGQMRSKAKKAREEAQKEAGEKKESDSEESSGTSESETESESEEESDLEKDDDENGVLIGLVEGEGGLLVRMEQSAWSVAEIRLGSAPDIAFVKLRPETGVSGANAIPTDYTPDGDIGNVLLKCIILVYYCIVLLQCTD